MSKNKWIRPVSFNKRNADDVARLKLIGQKSFSKFIKKLLDEEIERCAERKQPKQPTDDIEIKIGNRQFTSNNPNPPTFNPMLRGK